ncbi:helix-turn-helix domain-containing protein [Paenibacillus sp. RC67]|uniref:helix-turn-helix domain-containing protein n=1 Tax=Paenibacillus sp. RC67 TaxID=3039392 RepID=UPI0024AE3EC1|nr:helix-turn-helix domain-containing protein [Paenibacillus sp. RC67]
MIIRTLLVVIQIIELLTVEKIAQMLEMHPRTIRRYIREKQLKATPETVKIPQIIMWHMNETNPNRGKAMFQYFYDEVEKKGRYIIWGNPKFVGKVLTAVSEVTA